LGPRAKKEKQKRSLGEKLLFDGPNNQEHDRRLRARFEEDGRDDIVRTGKRRKREAGEVEEEGGDCGGRGWIEDE